MRVGFASLLIDCSRLGSQYTPLVSKKTNSSRTFDASDTVLVSVLTLAFKMRGYIFGIGLT